MNRDQPALDCFDRIESCLPGVLVQVLGAVAGRTRLVTAVASGGGSTSGVPGVLYWWRTTKPVCSSSATLSTKAVAEGVAMTHTRQPRSCARVTSLPTSRAAGVRR
ncbi:MAG TPA: hypothetical protein VHH34_20360 [Pseudonocardiaceae bacterium]|nr:hypothetical protein [Pseudonocardiaceae bacterium]